MKINNIKIMFFVGLFLVILSSCALKNKGEKLETKKASAENSESGIKNQDKKNKSDELEPFDPPRFIRKLLDATDVKPLLKNFSQENYESFTKWAVKHKDSAQKAWTKAYAALDEAKKAHMHNLLLKQVIEAGEAEMTRFLTELSSWNLSESIVDAGRILRLKIQDSANTEGLRKAFEWFSDLASHVSEHFKTYAASPDLSISQTPAEAMADRVKDLKENTLDFSEIFAHSEKQYKINNFLVLFGFRKKDPERLEKDYNLFKRFNDFLSDPTACKYNFWNIFKDLETCQQAEAHIMSEFLDSIKEDFLRISDLKKADLDADLLIDIYVAYFIGSNDPRIYAELARLKALADTPVIDLLKGESAYYTMTLLTVGLALDQIFGAKANV